MEEETKKTCFVIMPITTPDSYIDVYGDRDHFKHIMECLFEPAIRKAGFEPIPPTSKGSENIQADIIKKLETSDLVLCDMSTLNPNVFFEFGIRTALNKPICLVRDEFLKDIPFDPSSINCPKYSSDLSSWIVPEEIDKLSTHIKESYESNDRHNPLWKYFGFNMTARPEEGVATEEDKYDYLIRKLDTIIAQQSYSEMNIDRLIGSRNQQTHGIISKSSNDNLLFVIGSLFAEYGIKDNFAMEPISYPNGKAIFILLKEDVLIPLPLKAKLQAIQTVYDVKVEIVKPGGKVDYKSLLRD